MVAAAIAVLCAVALELAPGDAPGSTGPSEVPVATVAPTDPDELTDLPAGKSLLVRAVDEVAPRIDGRVYELTADGRTRPAGRLTCKRFHASPTGDGLCMALKANGISYEGIVFDRRYEPRRRFDVRGVPDRTRVSPDGKYGAYTVYDLGSSEGYFADASRFSTSTGIVDLRTGKRLVDLETQLRVTRNGKRFAPDIVQFWGVTFGRGGRFYATMGAGFGQYLIEGDVRTRRARVVGAKIECPSLSPDGTRIAYKQRIRYTDEWRFHVLDLITDEDVELAEPRSIDDQPEWWGNDHIVYSDDRALYTVPADGSGRPQRLAERATSPASVDLP